MPTSGCGTLAFAALAANPIGGLPVAIPFAVFKLHAPAWAAAVAGAPLAYVQVLAVDGAWSWLEGKAWWKVLLEKRRGPWAERLMASRGGFWVSFLGAFMGPWAVMAFARYASVPQRRVAPPILLSIACVAASVSAACAYLRGI